jgi:hypothetical protein
MKYIFQLHNLVLEMLLDTPYNLSEIFYFQGILGIKYRPSDSRKHPSAFHKPQTSSDQPRTRLDIRPVAASPCTAAAR